MAWTSSETSTSLLTLAAAHLDHITTDDRHVARYVLQRISTLILDARLGLWQQSGTNDQVAASSSSIRT